MIKIAREMNESKNVEKSIDLFNFCI